MLCVLAFPGNLLADIHTGDILAANFSNGVVRQYDPQTGQLLGSLGTALAGAVGIAFLPDGDIAVAESQNNRILRFDGGTGASKGVLSQNTVSNPRGLITSPAGVLWAASLNSDEVVGIDPMSGADLKRISVPRPMAAAVGNGRLYVTSQNSSIDQFDITTWQSLGTLASSVGTSLEAIVVAPDGDIVVNTTSPGLVRIDWQTGLIEKTASDFGGEGLAVAPDGLLYAPSGGALYAVDPLSLSIQHQVVASYLGSHGIAVKPVPEPPAMSLVCVAMAATARRRKRR